MRLRPLIARGLLAALSWPLIGSAVSASVIPDIQEICPPDETGRRAVLFEPQYVTVTENGDPYVCQTSESYVYQPAYIEDGVTISNTVIRRTVPSLCRTILRRRLKSQTYGWVEAGEDPEDARPEQGLEDDFEATRVFDDRDHPAETPIQLRAGYSDAYARIKAAPKCSWITPDLEPRVFTLYITDKRAVRMCQKDGSGVDTRILETPSTRQVTLSGERYGLVKNEDGFIEEFSEYVMIFPNRKRQRGCEWTSLNTPPKDASPDQP